MGTTRGSVIERTGPGGPPPPHAASTVDTADTSHGTRIRTLGMFAVHVDGRSVGLPRGLPRRALELAIVHGGHVHVEVAMERLWPDADPVRGRKGIRNILSRLAGVGAPVLVRDGELLRVPDDTGIDAIEFRELADRAVIERDADLRIDAATRALSLYRGVFLPGERFLEWTDPMRQRLRRRRVAMLDILAADARERDATDDAIRLSETALEDDPFDEVRYLELAELYLTIGRRGRAAQLVDLADHVLDGLGLVPDGAWLRLRRNLGSRRIRTKAHRIPRRSGVRRTAENHRSVATSNPQGGPA